MGNLLNSSVDEIMNSEHRRQYLDYIYGVTEAPSDFLCRFCEAAIYKNAQENGINVVFAELDRITMPD
jgi:hypothetical protein